MSPYMGGSAPAMADQVAAGYSLITAVQLKRLTDPEMDQFQFELEKLLRDVRSEVVDQEDVAAIQARNRKISRITGVLQQVHATKARRRRGA
jgi:hypothetical protein